MDESVKLFIAKMDKDNYGLTIELIEWGYPAKWGITIPIKNDYDRANRTFVVEGRTRAQVRSHVPMLQAKAARLTEDEYVEWVEEHQAKYKELRAARMIAKIHKAGRKRVDIVEDNLKIRQRRNKWNRRKATVHYRIFNKKK